MSDWRSSGSPQQSMHQDLSPFVMSIERTVLSSDNHNYDSSGWRYSQCDQSDTSYPTTSPYSTSKLEDTAEGLRNLIYDLRDEFENVNQGHESGVASGQEWLKIERENNLKTRIKELEERSHLFEEMNLTLKQKLKPIQNEAALYAIEAANANSRVLELMNLQAAESEKERATSNFVEVDKSEELKQYDDWAGNIIKPPEKSVFAVVEAKLIEFCLKTSCNALMMDSRVACETNAGVLVASRVNSLIRLSMTDLQQHNKEIYNTKDVDCLSASLHSVTAICQLVGCDEVKDREYIQHEWRRELSDMIEPTCKKSAMGLYEKEYQAFRTQLQDSSGALTTINGPSNEGNKLISLDRANEEISRLKQQVEKLNEVIMNTELENQRTIREVVRDADERVTKMTRLHEDEMELAASELHKLRDEKNIYVEDAAARERVQKLALDEREEENWKLIDYIETLESEIELSRMESHAAAFEQEVAEHGSRSLYSHRTSRRCSRDTQQLLSRLISRRSTGVNKKSQKDIRSEGTIEKKEEKSEEHRGQQNSDSARPFHTFLECTTGNTDEVSLIVDLSTLDGLFSNKINQGETKEGNQKNDQHSGGNVVQ